MEDPTIIHIFDPSVPHFNYPLKKKWRVAEAANFILAFFLLFAVIFLVLNFAAYWQRISGYFGRAGHKIEGEKLDVLAPSGLLAGDLTGGVDVQVAPTDFRLALPQIDQSVPLVEMPADSRVAEDWVTFEKDIQEYLRQGVVHYPLTANPGEVGNMVITGHSSYFPWAEGGYKQVFSRLDEIQIGDQIDIYKDQRRYRYKVFSKKVVAPQEVEVLNQTTDRKLLTVITCTPLGTTLRRLVVIAELEGVS